VKPAVSRVGVIGLLIVAALGIRATLLRTPPVPVTVFRVAPGRVEATVTNSKAGTVKVSRRSALSPEVGGRVATLAVRKGDSVKAGQVLLRLANRDLLASVRLEERSLQTARAAEGEACRRLEQAERELARTRRLAEQQIVSHDLAERVQSERDVAASACEAARARVGQAAAAIDLARATLDKSVLRAPFDGVVAELRTEVGEWITPSPTGIPIAPVLDLIDSSGTYVSAPLDEVDVAKVHTGLPARVTLDAFPGRSFMGTVRRVAPYVLDLQAQNRTFEVEVELADAAMARQLPPGASADVEVILDARDGALRVPSYAVVEGGKVLVVRDGTLHEQAVKTGLKNWEFAEITAGLSSGDPVVVSLDRAEVKDGARVRIAGEALK
jgi:HlyD family secretion protein